LAVALFDCQSRGIGAASSIYWGSSWHSRPESARWRPRTEEGPWVAARIHQLDARHGVFPIGLDVGDERILPQRRRRRIGQTRRKTLERAGVGEQQRSALRSHQRLRELALGQAAHLADRGAQPFKLLVEAF